MVIGTRTFTTEELEEFLKDGGVCRFTDKNSWCVYDESFTYPYRFYYDTYYDSEDMSGVWRFADGIQEWFILKEPSMSQISLNDLYPKRIHFKL